jgi:hypothetical protein
VLDGGYRELAKNL